MICESHKVLVLLRKIREEVRGEGGPSWMEESLSRHPVRSF